MGFGSQLGLLLWKNWILQKRRVCVSIFEVALPVFFAALVLLLRLVISTNYISSPTIYDREQVSSFYLPNASIGFVPETSETRMVMQLLLEKLNGEPEYGFNNLVVVVVVLVVIVVMVV
ncbi:ATP-binding cassette sub-family A member 3 [Elysia marginata]|uniref:ATP-binding cassette sub-family A member 3 n=1 Tax=Elysia marginata TaxID=1093978 RepID=A0AAV4IPH2_9GAST|nr:ATP-binding cassette sub-family A member 3 [Elysia marginata]